MITRSLEEIFGDDAACNIKIDLASPCPNLSIHLVCLDVNEVRRVQRFTKCLATTQKNVHVSLTFDDMRVIFPQMSPLANHHRYVDTKLITIIKTLETVFADAESVCNATRGIKSDSVVFLKTCDETVRDLVRNYLSRNISEYFVCFSQYKPGDLHDLKEDMPYVFFASPWDAIPVRELLNHRLTIFTDKMYDAQMKTVEILFGSGTQELMHDILRRYDKRFILLVCHDPESLFSAIKEIVKHHPDHPIVMPIGMEPDRSIIIQDSLIREENFTATNCVIRISDTFGLVRSTAFANCYTHLTNDVKSSIRALGSMFKEPERVWKTLRDLMHNPIGRIVVLKSDAESLREVLRSVVSQDIPIHSVDGLSEIRDRNSIVILRSNEAFTDKMNHADMITYVDKSLSVQPSEPANEPNVPEMKPATFTAKSRYVTKIVRGAIKCYVLHANGDVSRFDATIGEVEKDDFIRAAILRNMDYDTNYDRKKFPKAVDIQVAEMTNETVTQWCVYVGGNFYTDLKQLVRVFEEIKVCRLVMQNHQESLCKIIKPDELYDLTYQDFDTLRYFKILHQIGTVTGCVKLSDLAGFRSFLNGSDAKFTSWLTLFQKSGDMLQIKFADMDPVSVPVACFWNNTSF